MSDLSVSRAAPTSRGPASPTRVEDGPATPITVTVRYFAAARAAAGLDEEAVTIDPPATVTAVIEAITARHGDALARVLGRCSYLHNAVAVRDPSSVLEPGDDLDVLPPFAGG